MGMNIRLSIAIWVMLLRCLATHPPLSQAVGSYLPVTFRTEYTIDASKVALDEIDSRLCVLRIGSSASLIPPFSESDALTCCPRSRVFDKACHAPYAHLCATLADVDILAL